MFEFNYSQQLQFDVIYCRKNRHGTYIFNLLLKAEGCKDYAHAKIYLNKHQEIQINFDERMQFGVKSVGIFKEDITKKLSAQITVQQLTELIK